MRVKEAEKCWIYCIDLKRLERLNKERKKGSRREVSVTTLAL